MRARLYHIAVYCAIATCLTLAVLLPAALAEPCSNCPPHCCAVNMLQAVASTIAVTDGDEQIYGAGFVAGDGLVITAAHVVEGMQSVGVKLKGKEVRRAKVLIVSPQHDVAVLHADVKEARALPLAKQPPQPGDTCFLVGHPGGFLSWTVTRGVVSALDREVHFADVTIYGALQHDAASNPGSSGGPLLSARGEVIAMHIGSHIQLRGVGIAIPASTLRAYLELASRKRP